MHNIESFVIAAVFTATDEGQIEYGGAEEVALLHDLADQERRARAESPADKEDKPKPMQCLIYAGQPGAGRSVLCASDDAALCLVTFDDHELPEVLSEWQKFSA